MSKSLSEQVAELEAERDNLQRQVQEARDERDESQTEVERLTESRNDWLQFGRDHVARANRLYAENANLRAKAEALRAGQGRWPRLGPAVAPTVPRAITADELREGQVVAVKYDGEWERGDVYADHYDQRVHLIETYKFSMYGRAPHTIVLLEDAPQPTGYADDDHQDAEVLQWHQPTPRLTVHDLEVAPVGTQVRADDLALRKDARGEWVMLGDSNAVYRVSDIIQWPEATLTAPERP